MSIDSDLSDTEVSTKQDDKDEEFKIDDYRNEIDSDDSYCDIPETDKSNNVDGEGEKTEEPKENEYVGPVLPGGHRFDRKFICVKYPGNVVNPDKAMETLGGICAISTAVETQNRRLELRFRPDNAYRKPACGDRHCTTGFLLRVRVKKSRIKQAEEEEAKRTRSSKKKDDSDDVKVGKDKSTDDQTEEGGTKRKVQEENEMSELTKQVEGCSVSTDDLKDSPDVSIESEKNSKDKDNTPNLDSKKYADLSEDTEYEVPKLKVLGRIETEFRFTNLCDFQYLPLTQCRSDPKKLECLYDLIYPTNIPSHSWLKNEVPYFLPPAAFSRMDTIQQYVPKTEVDTSAENVIGKSKKRKAGFSNFMYFSTAEVPTGPPAGIETALKVKFIQNVHLDQIRRIFEERPIWSKNAIMYKTKFSHDRLKVLLPSVAYYFMNGPWKIMWVKLGYDPRTDITARKYQTLDYRLKAMHGLGSTVKCKRNYSDYSLPYKLAPTSKQKTTILSAALSQEHSQKKEESLSENVYIYREGTVPPSRQMFYQYCDVLVDEIQEMLAKLPDPQPGTRCHEKRGWLPSGFDVQCREIINKQVRAVLRKKMNIPEDHPTSLPRKRKRGIKVRLNKLRTKRQKKRTVDETEEKYDTDEPKPSTSTKED